MPLKDILQKRDKIRGTSSEHVPATPTPSDGPSALAVPQIKFIRSDTTSQEIINPPIYDADESDRVNNRFYVSAKPDLEHQPPPPTEDRSSRRRLSLFSLSRSPSESSTVTSPPRVRGERRLSQLLHLDRGSRNSSRSSVNIPSDLPQIRNDNNDEQDREAQWEKRATLLVQQTQFGARVPSPSASLGSLEPGAARPSSRSSSPGQVNDPQGDVSAVASCAAWKSVANTSIGQYPRSDSAS